MSSPQQGLNKENLGATPLSQPSTSAKTLDVGLSDNGTLSSPRLSSPLTSSSPDSTSPLRSRSPRKQNSSPLRRTFAQKTTMTTSSLRTSRTIPPLSSSESLLSGKEEARALRAASARESLKHKDSLDLARRRPISFIPTTHAYRRPTCSGGHGPSQRLRLLVPASSSWYRRRLLHLARSLQRKASAPRSAHHQSLLEDLCHSEGTTRSKILQA